MIDSRNQTQRIGETLEDLPIGAVRCRFGVLIYRPSQNRWVCHPDVIRRDAEGLSLSQAALFLTVARKEFSLS